MTTITIGKADADNLAAKVQELIGSDAVFPLRVKFTNKRKKRPVLVNAVRTHAHLYGGESAELQFRRRDDLYNALQDLTHFASVGGDELLATVTYGEETAIASTTAAAAEVATEATDSTDTAAGAAE
ncbi:hypothetical protein [Pseudomonas sp.]|jgi:hypothetical protein|uniref:hypothetical protein n=1 Tax=Pseudomonas sp. TaxID=306 RepID=UPI002EDABEC1